MVHRDYSALRLARSITSHLAGSIATPFSHYLQRSVIPQLKTNLTATYAYPTPEPCVWHLCHVVKEGGLCVLGLRLPWHLHYITLCITPNQHILLPLITTLYYVIVGLSSRQKLFWCVARCVCRGSLVFNYVGVCLYVWLGVS